MAQDIEANIVKVGEKEIPAKIFLSLAQYVIENISSGLNTETIKQNLIKVGWEPSVLELMFETDKIFEKYYSKEIGNTSPDPIQNSSEEHESFSLEKLENMDQELKDTISNFTKFEGKLESEASKIDQYQDRLDVLKDSLSETRGMFMSSEKRMAEFDLKIEKAESIISDFDPKTLQQRFALVDKKLDTFEGQLTKLEVQLQDSNKKLSQYLDLMKKIKSQESVVENLNQLRDKMKEFQDIKSDLDRKSGKIEVIFQELQDKNSKIETAYSKVDSFNEIIKDIIRDVDRVSVKNATMVSKDEMNKNFSKLRDEIEVIKNVIYDSKKKKSFFGLGKKNSEEETQEEIKADSLDEKSEPVESKEDSDEVKEEMTQTDSTNLENETLDIQKGKEESSLDKAENLINSSLDEKKSDSEKEKSIEDKITSFSKEAQKT